MSQQSNSGSIVIYARSDQPDAKAISQQYEVAQRAAEAQLGELATVMYCDEGMAGSMVRRPALQALLQHVDAGFVRAIVVTSNDRLTRSYIDDLRLRVRFQDAGIPLVVAAHLGPETPDASSDKPVGSDIATARAVPPSPWFVRALSALRIKAP
jgi:DNA invertase Pin-like site-specific DNA recombinase